MIYVLTEKDSIIIGAVNTKRIVGFYYDGTSPEFEPRYILELEWGHTLTVSALDMQHILFAMVKEEGDE